MENKTTVVNGGMSLSSMLTVLFVALKLTGVIGWSWWWVVSPTLISIGLAVGVVVVALVILALLKNR